MDQGYSTPTLAARTPGGVGLSAAKLAIVLAKLDRDFVQPISVGDLAQLVHLSKFHFARAFRKATGTSPHVYITVKRMERAQAMLADTDTPVREIAQLVGYATQAHFTAMFRRHFGVPPATYRRSLGRQGREGPERSEDRFPAAPA